VPPTTDRYVSDRDSTDVDGDRGARLTSDE